MQKELWVVSASLRGWFLHCLLFPYMPVYFQMMCCFCAQHRYTHPYAHASVFSVYFFWNHIAQAWKLKNIPLPYQPVETFLMTVRSNHNRQWVNISVGRISPPSSPVNEAWSSPADFSIWPYHSWKPASKEINGKMWKRDLPGHRRWRRGPLMWSSGSLMKTHWKPAACFWMLSL